MMTTMRPNDCQFNPFCLINSITIITMEYKDVAYCCMFCGLCVCLSVVHTSMHELTEMPFGLWTQVGPSPRNHVLGGGPDPAGAGAILGLHAMCPLIEILWPLVYCTVSQKATGGSGKEEVSWWFSMTEVSASTDSQAEQQHRHLPVKPAIVINTPLGL